MTNAIKKNCGYNIINPTCSKEHACKILACVLGGGSRRFRVRARLISTEVSAVKAVSSAANAVPPAALMLF